MKKNKLKILFFLGKILKMGNNFGRFPKKKRAFGREDALGFIQIGFFYRRGAEARSRLFSKKTPRLCASAVK
jgi:hypothetical protein